MQRVASRFLAAKALDRLEGTDPFLKLKGNGNGKIKVKKHGAPPPR
jgi:hypothetical protein